MVAELSFSTYSEVMHSWERIRRVKDFDKTLGVLVLKKFFSIHPEATNVFGLYDEEEQCITSGSYVKTAKKFVNFCDSFMDMLGPDSDMMTDILAEEGRKHADIGVKLEHYPSMGVALIEGVRTLDRKFNDDTELCWRQVYSGISHDMGKAGIYHRARRRNTM